VEEHQPREGDGSGNDEVGAIQLVGGSSTSSGPRVGWSEDVVDNEGAGRKSSKICCIYHKPRRFDESSSEESSDSDSDSDSSWDGHDHNHDRTNNHPRSRHPRHNHRHEHPTNGDDANMRNRDGGDGVIHEIDKDDGDHNTYERGSKGKSKGKGVKKD